MPASVGKEIVSARQRLYGVLPLVAAAIFGAILVVLLMPGNHDENVVNTLQAELARLKTADATTVETLRAEIAHLRAEVAWTQHLPRAGTVPPINGGAQMHALKMEDAHPRRLALIPEEPARPVKNEAFEKLKSSWDKVKGSLVTNFTHAKKAMKTSVKKSVITALKSIEEIGATKYRVHNVRYVFLGISWIFILTTLAAFIVAEYQVWVIPQYQALQIQVMLMFLGLAVTPSAELFISRRNFLLELFEVFLEGHILFCATLWLPRILEAIVEKVQRVRRSTVQEGVAALFSTTLHQEVDTSYQTNVCDCRITPLDMDNYEEDKLGVPETYTLRVSMFLLFFVRPILCAVMVSDVFAIALPDPRMAIIFRASSDFCILWAATNLLSHGGKALVKKNPSQFMQLRLLSVTVQVLVCIPPFMDATLQWLSPDIILAIQLSDLIHLCIISVCCCIVCANRLSHTAVLAYVADVRDHHRANLDGIFERYHSDSFRKACTSYLFNPLLPFQSLRVPKEGWTALGHTICLCLQLEEDALRHWRCRKASALDHKPAMPYEMLEEEKALEQCGELEKRSTWHFVFSDSFTLRVRSANVNMGVISIFMTVLVFKDEFFPMGSLNPWQTLGVQIIFGITIWFVAGILLIGNNIFVPRHPWFTVASHVWVSAMIVSFAWNIQAFMHPADTSSVQLSFQEAVLGPDFRMWIHLVMAILCLFLLLLVVIQMRFPERYSDFIAHELHSLMYCRALLESRVSRQKAITFETLKSDFMQVIRPIKFLPPVLMLSMVMSLVVVTAFSAVMADSATRVFLVVDEMHDLAIVGGAYFRQKADCNTTGFDLAKVVDLDKSGSVSREELPLYTLLKTLPRSIRHHLASERQVELLWPSEDDRDLTYTQVAKMLCKVERAGKYRLLNTHGLGGIIESAQHVNLTGKELLRFYGGAISRREARLTLFENLAVLIPSKALDLSENVVDSVWPKLDVDRNGELNITEAGWVAVGLNFLFGRAPILLSLVPCPHEVEVYHPGAAEQFPPANRRLGYLVPVADMLHMTDVNHDNVLQRKEWLMLVAVISWVPGMSWGKKFLTDLFDYFAGPYEELKWDTVYKLSEALDAFIQTAADLPKMIKEKKVSAKYFIPYLDDNKDGKLSRSEMHGFESYLTEQKMAARANTIMDTAFKVTDMDGDGILSGPELEAGVFGESLEDSIGTMTLRAMQRAVASTPANCKDLREKSAANSSAPVRSLLGRVLLSFVGAPEMGIAPHADEQENEEPWEERASRHLLMSAPILHVNASDSAEQPSNVYELASQFKAKASMAKEGMENTLDFFNTLQDVTSPDRGSMLDALYKEVASNRLRSCIWYITLGVIAANIVSDIFSVYVCYKMVLQFNDLTESLRKGKADEKRFQGHTFVSDGRLKNSFSSSAYLPGTMWFTVILGWIACFSVCNAIWTGIVVGAHFPSDVMQIIGPYVKYISGTLVIMLFLRYVVIDRFLVQGGEVIHPRIFSLAWMMLVVINFVIGVSLAVLRLVIIFIYTLVSGCFLHYSLMPEIYLRVDHGYFAFLSMAYTYYERHNPIKSAFVTVLMPQVHKLYGRKKPEQSKESFEPDGGYYGLDAVSTDDSAARKYQRAKARFALLLTLARNKKALAVRKGEEYPPGERQIPYTAEEMRFRRLKKDRFEEMERSETYDASDSDDSSIMRDATMCPLTVRDS